MLLWDGDLLNFHFGSSANSLESWGVSFGQGVGVSSGQHGVTPDPFSSEGLNGHWTLDNLMPLLSAEHLIDLAASPAEIGSSSLGGTVETTAVSHHGQTSALILPTVVKVEEPFALPLPVDISVNLPAIGLDYSPDAWDGLIADPILAKPIRAHRG
jgi:hypothetical protein